MRGKKWSRKNLLLYALAITAFVLLPHFVSGYVASMLVLIGIYGIAASALNLLLGNTGQISLGQAAFYGIGAYTSVLLTTKLGLSFWLAMPAGGLMAACFGYLVGLTSVRLRHAYLAMATIAFNEIFIVVLEQWQTVTGGVGGIPGIARPSFFGYPLLGDTGYLYLVWILLFLMLLVNGNLLASRIGNTLAAIREDEVASAALGIGVASYKLKIFTLSAFYTGIAGSLFAHYARFIGPGSFYIHFSIVLLIMVELGGTRAALGGVAGAGVVVLLPEILSFMSKFTFLPEPVRLVLGEYSYHLIIYGVILFLIAAFAPGGLAKWIPRLLRHVIISVRGQGAPRYGTTRSGRDEKD